MSVKGTFPPLQDRPSDARTRWFFIVSFALIVGWLLSGLIPVTLQRASPAARCAYCETNLKQIAEALRSYSENNSGNLPVSLSDLVPGYIADKRVLCCPFHPWDTSKNDQCDYKMLESPLLSPTTGTPPRILCYDRYPHPEYGKHPSGRNVLFSNLEIQFVSESKFGVARLKEATTGGE